ncbi:ADP-heptose--LPS heptosyltransferase RfaF [Orbaceae bacterium ESL0727]|nr:ADP-heptose--LPS heptosyltransferase RfaF [Orbaceae bacterium ESL0727]
MKILVIGPSWVGDMMMSQSLYRTLKQRNPTCQIDVMAPEWCRALLNKMPEVNRAIPMPLKHGELALAKRYQLGKALRANHYDQAIVLPNSFKSALIPFFAKIPKRTGWQGEMRYGLLNDRRKLNKPLFPLMVERYVALAYPKDQIHCAADLPKPLLYPKLQVTEAEIQAALAAFQIPHNGQLLIGFCPGAEFGPAKRWPDYHYAALADKLASQNATILLFGSAKDQPVGEQIKRQMTLPQHCINLAGRTQLEQAICLIAACLAIVTNDSGLMHVAAALDRPLVALYGPSSPDFTPPLSQHAKVIRLITGYHRIRKGDGEQGYHQSLIDIDPNQVFTMLTNLLPQLNADKPS